MLDSQPVGVDARQGYVEGIPRRGPMAHCLAQLVAAARRALVACLLVGLLSLGAIAPAWAAPQAPEGSAAGPGSSAGPPVTTAKEKGGTPRAEGPRNPYDMKALRQFDAGSHRAEEPG
ncbi:MAG: hypothetical protein ACK59G_15315 [Cyanobacteriota bacterium]|jgi:hypothetical protein